MSGCAIVRRPPNRRRCRRRSPGEPRPRSRRSSRRTSSRRRHAIGVEHRVDVSQAADALAELLAVSHLDDEPVLDHRVLGRAERLDDVDAGLGEGSREILEQAGAIPGVDLELDPVGGRVVALPLDLGEALGRALERAHVLAVLAVDRDAAPQRHVPDDRIARHRPAALGQPDHHVVDALDLDPVVGGLLSSALALVATLEDAGEARLGLVAGHSLALLQALEDLVGDRLWGDLALADRDVEVVRLAEPHLAGDVREQRRRGDALRRQAPLADRVLQLLAAAPLRIVTALALEEGPDLVAGAAGADDGEPVPRWPALLLGGQDLDDVAGLQ